MLQLDKHLEKRFPETFTLCEMFHQSPNVNIMVMDHVSAGFEFAVFRCKSPAVLPVFLFIYLFFCHWPNVFWAPDTQTAQVPVQFSGLNFKSLLHRNRSVLT